MLNGYVEWLKTQKIGEKEPGSTIRVHENAADYFTDEPTPKTSEA
jgi:hypothetical protein